ncbi:MAG: hypothetical protein C7B45_02465 [Sulfobacillus acidophilus]|uniref:Uncharacterized protein n=1 Tax=Sulfobacillus acidophilus TaxID=53633 RepID=A0A2T2WN40_9FIRM|nr:MAG: hypothetical protein C7B45_02465 [Sulfobacillus acidophilus]
MRRRWFSGGRRLWALMLGIGVFLSAVLGLVAPAAHAAPLAPPRSVAPFVPTNTRLLGKEYLPALATLVLWAQQKGGSYPPGLWVVFVQHRETGWQAVTVRRWSALPLASKPLVRMNPAGHEGAVILPVSTGGNAAAETMFLNFVVSPTKVTLAYTVTGYSGYVTGGSQSFREIFSSFAEQFTWRGPALIAQHEGLLETIPPGAHVIPVYLYPGQPTPTILGSPVIHLKVGQPIAMRPDTVDALHAVEHGTLAMYGPFPTRGDADPLSIFAADTILGLTYPGFSRPGTYYLDLATSTTHFVVLTVVVSRA